MASAIQALRAGDATAAEAAAQGARSEADRAVAAAEATKAAAAEAEEASIAARSLAPTTPEGTKAARQGADAASFASTSAENADRAAEQALDAAGRAAAVAELATALADATKRFEERSRSDGDVAREAEEASAAAAEAVAAAVKRAAVASDEMRSSEVADAIARAQEEASRARDAAVSASALVVSHASALDELSALEERAAMLDEPVKDVVKQALASLRRETEEHAQWLRELAATAEARAVEGEKLLADAQKLDPSVQHAEAGALPLPSVPAAPSERERRPTGLIPPEPGQARVPHLGRFRQVSGGSGPDWAPGGYSESTLSLRADGILELRRNFPGEFVSTWRVGFRWENDKTVLVLGEDERSRPPARTLQGFDGGPVTATDALPVRLRCELLANGSLKIAGKTYAKVE